MKQVTTVLLSLSLASAQTAVVFDPPPPSYFYQNSTFIISGATGFVASFDDCILWSFDPASGDLIDPDGLVVPGPCSDLYIFTDSLMAIPGNFESEDSYWGILIVDITDPAQLQEVVLIPLDSNSCISGQNVAMDSDGETGYITSFTDDKLHSFSVQTTGLVDPDGLCLPANPYEIAIAGDRIAIAGCSDDAIMVVDVSDPANMLIAGSIPLPQPFTFSSNNNIVFADDCRTGFISTNERVLYSFDVIDLELLDPDGIVFGTQQLGGTVAICGNSVSCLYSRGLSFIDVSDPTQMTLISNANFGETVAPQGSATVAFSADGSRAAFPAIYPGNYIYTFDVSTGQQFMPRYPVDAQPNYLTVLGPDNKVGVLCSTSSTIWIIDGLLGTAGIAENALENPDTGSIPLSFAPNPMLSTALISFSVAADESCFPVSLEIYDITGRMVCSLIDGVQPEGDHSVVWNGCDSSGSPVAGGVYLLYARSAYRSATEKLVRIHHRLP